MAVIGGANLPATAAAMKAARIAVGQSARVGSRTPAVAERVTCIP
jgi:hypothetical protein